MSQKYRRLTYRRNRSIVPSWLKRAKKARSNKITFAQQVAEQQVIDEERDKVEKKQREVEIRKSVWTDNFEIGGAL